MIGKTHLNPNNNYGELMDKAFQNFEKLLKVNNLSAFHVSKELGYSSSYFYNWKKGKSFPTLMALCNISEYFNISLLELLGYESNNISEMDKEILHRFNSLNANKQMDVIAYIVGLQKVQEQEDLEFKKRLEESNTEDNNGDDNGDDDDDNGPDPVQA